MRDDLMWWQKGVIYQIYPRSFQDSDGDGIGDLSGIRARLGHLERLGVDAVWVSPVFPSPMADFGYDISDYRGVEPMFGTMDDLDGLIADLHGRGMKLLLDFVPSHTSDQHPWFQDSRSSREAEKRDWYIWRDAGTDGGPPTNWISEFSGPAWTWDTATSQYYLHLYLPEQPALNWRNPAVQSEMLDTLRFWFDRGVDGFRVDAVEHMAPDPDRGDNPENPEWAPGIRGSRRHIRANSAHQPAVFDYVRQMRAVADQYEARALVGEAYGSIPQVMEYYGTDLDGFHLPFNFVLLDAPWEAEALARLIRQYERALPEGGWPNWVLGNHDAPRVATRVGSDQARVAMMLLLSLRGTPTIYQGDELGMEDVDVPRARLQDPWEVRNPGQEIGRDRARVPIRWSDGPGGGFTDGEPWLPLGEAPPAEAQADDAGSMLSFTRRLIALRREEPALFAGAIEAVEAVNGVLRFARVLADRRLHVALNMTASEQPLNVQGRCLVSCSGDEPEGRLAAHDGLIFAPH